MIIVLFRLLPGNKITKNIALSAIKQASKKAITIRRSP